MSVCLCICFSARSCLDVRRSIINIINKKNVYESSGLLLGTRRQQKKTESLRQSLLTLKQIRYMKQESPAHIFTDTSFNFDVKNLKFVKLYRYLGSEVNCSEPFDHYSLQNQKCYVYF